MDMLPFRFSALVGAALLAALPAQDSQRPAGADFPAARADAAKVPGQAPAAITIGTVDLDKALEHYPWAVEEQKRLTALRERFNVEMDELGKRVESLRAEMSLLKRGSPDYEEKEVDLRSAVRVLEDVGTLRSRQFDRELASFRVAVYEDMDFAVAQVARQRGIDLVLRVVEHEDEPTPDDEPGSEVMAKLSHYTRRTVWFASERVDLTPHLVKYLQTFDVRAEREKAAGGAAGKSGAATGGDGRK